MNHRIILKASALVSLIFGIALVFAPNALMSMYRTVEPLAGPGIYNSMLLGAILLGLAVMNWAASDAPELSEIHYVLLGNLVMHSLAFLVAVYRQVTNPDAPASAWLNVAIFVAFTFLYAYLYLASPAGYKLHARTTHA